MRDFFAALSRVGALVSAGSRTVERIEIGQAAEGRLVSFLLDTNVVSEWVRPRPDAGMMLD